MVEKKKKKGVRLLELATQVKRKTLAVLTCFNTVVIAAILPPVASASPVEFNLSTNGKVSNCILSLPVKSVGQVLLSSGQVTVENDSVRVSTVPDWLYDQHVVLEGVLVRCKLTEEGTQPFLRGLTYFKSGDYLSSLGHGSINESVETTNGLVYAGTISSVSSSSLSIESAKSGRVSIVSSDVENIHSPFSYWLVIPLANTKTVTGTKTETKCQNSSVAFVSSKDAQQTASSFSHSPRTSFKLPKSTLLGTEGGITRSAIGAMIAGDALNTMAPLVALPLTMTLGQRRAHNTINGYTNANRLNDFVLHMPTVTPPTAMF